LPGHDDPELEEGLHEEPVDAGEEMTLSEARWALAVVVLFLAVLASWVAFSGVGSVSNTFREQFLGPLRQAANSSVAALRSAVGESADKVGAVAGTIGAVSNSVSGDVVGALQQAVDSSTAAIDSATGGTANAQSPSRSPAPADKQYHTKVSICMTQEHLASRVSARSVPTLVSKGAIYPVPGSGCP
jgi:hypothetical protein